LVVVVVATVFRRRGGALRKLRVVVCGVWWNVWTMAFYSMLFDKYIYVDVSGTFISQK
jgi:hypothetical protein